MPVFFRSSGAEFKLKQVILLFLSKKWYLNILLICRQGIPLWLMEKVPLFCILGKVSLLHDPSIN